LIDDFAHVLGEVMLKSLEPLFWAS